MVSCLQDCLRQLQASTRDLTCRGVLLRSNVEGMQIHPVLMFSPVEGIMQADTPHHGVLVQQQIQGSFLCDHAIRTYCTCAYVLLMDLGWTLSAGAFCAGSGPERKEGAAASRHHPLQRQRARCHRRLGCAAGACFGRHGRALRWAAVLRLALAADVRAVSARASMGFPETGLGIIPGVGGAALIIFPATVEQLRA